MKHIHIVMGSQGEYSDFQEWPVIAYTKRRKADEHAKKALDRSLEISREFGKALKLSGPKYWARCKEIDQTNKYDKEMEPDYAMDEVNYYVWTVEIADGRKAL